MTDAANPAQMHVRLSRFLPLDIKRTVSPTIIDDACKAAWDNGWRDPAWLAGYALEGTGMDSVRNAAAMFTSRLRDAAAMPCPTDDTTGPPRAFIDPTPTGPPAHDPKGHVEACRDALRRREGAA